VSPSDLDLLRAFLGCNTLPHNWYDFYGIRKARSDALTKPSYNKSGFSRDSFINPNSETALTLFALGSTDCWRQVDAFTNSPRVAGDSWNRRFFADLLEGNAGSRSIETSLWHHHVGEGAFFCNDPVDFERLILLFEFEVAGSAFHQRTDKQDNFKDLSFLKIDDLQKWSKFDAVLIDAARKCFYFVEAKLGSDISTGTEKYPLINQIVRSLEAAFWLTTHEDSKYHGWKFRYVFVSSSRIYKYKLRHYAFLLASVDEMLANYRRLLVDVYKDDLRLAPDTFEQRFSEFTKTAREAVRIVPWEAFGKVLVEQKPQLWEGYFDRIRQLYVQAVPEEKVEQAINDIKRRFQVAGIEYPG
jgi:hypothetical protein